MSRLAKCDKDSIRPTSARNPCPVLFLLTSSFCISLLILVFKYTYIILYPTFKLPTQTHTHTEADIFRFFSGLFGLNNLNLDMFVKTQITKYERKDNDFEKKILKLTSAVLPKTNFHWFFILRVETNQTKGSPLRYSHIVLTQYIHHTQNNDLSTNFTKTHIKYYSLRYSCREQPPTLGI